uniref:Uncharacterized protein n=1 Tax=Rhinolophus ferrumequinum TaxID=59479 RepID=A0A671G1H3_RHIFE
MTKTKAQRGLLEPVTHIRKPHSIQAEMGLLAQKDAWYRYTWDRSLFLIYRRKELQSVMAELDFSQQDINGLEVVGRGQPFSTVTVEDFSVTEESQRSSLCRHSELVTSLEKTPMNTESLAYFRSPVMEPQLSRQERLTLRDSQDSFRSKKTRVGVRSSGGKSIMEEILVEGSPDLESAKSPWELEGLPWTLGVLGRRVAHNTYDPARQ